MNPANTSSFPVRGIQQRAHVRVDGFSLVELAVTIAIRAIIAGIAVPSFNNLVRGSRLSSSANEMVALLQTARNGAIGNRASVQVCPSANGTTCAGVLGSRWIALMTKGGVTSVLRDSQLHPTLQLAASPNLAAGSNRFSFAPTGFSAVGTNASGTLGLCIPGMAGNNAVAISASVGRISTAKRAGTSSCTAPADN